jgi:hypothetical protein
MFKLLVKSKVHLLKKTLENSSINDKGLQTFLVLIVTNKKISEKLKQ